MVDVPMRAVLGRLRRLVEGRAPGSCSDGQLVLRFSGDRDEGAFAELLARHGPMVLAVCERQLGCTPDAEDAFQATFLLLTRKARSIHQPDAVGSWLYGVAYRIARRVQAIRRRPRRAVSNRAPPVNPASSVTWQEVREILDEELARLPDRYRLPVLLCCLEGKSQEEAARQLGWESGSLRGRLDRGREQLRRRLQQRGLTLSTALGSLLLANSVGRAAMPAAFLEASMRACVSADVNVSPQVLQMAQEATRVMFLKQLQWILMLVLVVCTAAAGVGVVLHQVLADPPPLVQAVARPAQANPVAPTDLYGDPLPKGAVARLGTVRWRDPESLLLKSFVADGKELLLVDSWGLARVLEAGTGKELRRFGLRLGPDEPRAYDRDVCLSADGRLLAQLGYADRLMRVWEVSTGRERWQSSWLPPREGRVEMVGFSPDGQTLALTIPGKGIALREGATGKELGQLLFPGRLGHGNLVAAFSPDSQRLAAAGSDGVIDIWELRTARRVRQVGRPPKPADPTYRTCNRLLYTADGKGLLAIIAHHDIDKEKQELSFTLARWDAEGKEDWQVALPQDNRYGSWTFSPDARVLAWLDGENVFRLLHLETGKELRRLGKPTKSSNSPRPLFAPDAKALLAQGFGDDRDAGVESVMWDVPSGQERWRRSHPPSSFDFAPDGTTLLVREVNRTVKRWDAATGRDRHLTGGHLGQVYTIGHSNGTTWTTMATDGIRRWDAATSRETQALAAKSNHFLNALSPDGRLHAYPVQKDGFVTAVQLWDVVSDAPGCLIELAQPNLLALTFTSDGQGLAGWCADGVVRIWDPAGGKCRETITPQLPTGQAGEVFTPGTGMYPLRFSPDGSLLAVNWMTSADLDVLNAADLEKARKGPLFAIVVMSVRTGKAMGQIVLPRKENLRVTGWTPDGRSLAVVTEEYIVAQGRRPRRTLALYEIATGKERFRVSVGGIGSLAIRSDNQLLAAGGEDGSILLWDPHTGQEVGQLQGHEAEVRCLAFLADGRLISASADTTALVWDTARLGKRAPDSPELEARHLEAMWQDLAGEEAAKAFQAMHTLAQRPKQAVPWLRGQLDPVNPPDVKRLDRLISDLDNANAAVRQDAEDQLEIIGVLAQPALEKVLAAGPALETRQRLGRLMDRLTTRVPASHELRVIRTVELLERIGTQPAREVLARWNQGAEGARLTQESKAALARNVFK